MLHGVGISIFGVANEAVVPLSLFELVLAHSYLKVMIYLLMINQAIKLVKKRVIMKTDWVIR